MTAIGCMICGTRKYGAEADRIVAEAARAKAEATERARLEAARAKATPTYTVRGPIWAARAAARASRLAELGGDGSTLCASPWCANPHSENGRYCGKTCSDDVARARYKARKGKAP